MTDEEQDERETKIIDTIERDPHDDDLRRVYGDWLEEQGRLAESEFVAVELGLRELARARADPVPEGAPAREGAPAEAAAAAAIARLVQMKEHLRQLAERVHPAFRQRIGGRLLRIENCNVPLRFDFECPKTWDQLEPTPDRNVRECNACNKTVHFAPTVPAARLLAAQGRCVAVDLTAKRNPNDLLPAAPRFTLGRIRMLTPPPPEKVENRFDFSRAEKNELREQRHRKSKKKPDDWR